MISVNLSEKEIQASLNILRRIPTATGDVAQDELHKSGLTIETSAKQDTPVDTGRLRSSLHMESSEVNRSFTYSDQAGRSYSGKLSVMPKPLEVYVGTNVEYAEKIHRTGGRGGKGEGFLVKAHEAERPLLIARLRTKIKEVARGKGRGI